MSRLVEITKRNGIYSVNPNAVGPTSDDYSIQTVNIHNSCTIIYFPAGTSITAITCKNSNNIYDITSKFIINSSKGTAIGPVYAFGYSHPITISISTIDETWEYTYEVDGDYDYHEMTLVEE